MEALPVTHIQKKIHRGATCSRAVTANATSQPSQSMFKAQGFPQVRDTAAKTRQR